MLAAASILAWLVQIRVYVCVSGFSLGWFSCSLSLQKGAQDSFFFIVLTFLQVARKYDFLIVEDDPYYFLQFTKVSADRSAPHCRRAAAGYGADRIPGWLRASDPPSH